MFSFFEHLILPTAGDSLDTPPSGIFAFYWHFIRQIRGLFIGLVVIGCVLAAMDVIVPMFFGKMVSLIADTPRDTFIRDTWPVLAGMAVVVLVVRPVMLLIFGLVQYQALMPGLANLVLWQSHWHVVRQDLAFFQKDIAGRIGSQVVETGLALRSSTLSLVSVCWYLVALIVGTFGILMRISPWFAVPLLAWAIGYVALLVALVPRINSTSKTIATAHSDVVGSIVDSYSNISTLKLFAVGEQKDASVRRSIDKHTRRTHTQMRWFTLLASGMSTLSGLLMTSIGAMNVWLWTRDSIDLQSIATALSLALQVTGVASRVAFEFTAILQQVGKVHEGMCTIAQPHALVDDFDARELVVSRGAISFRKVSFSYGDQSRILDRLSLTVRSGERIGLIGKSGTGKSTLINILLRFYDIQSGQILIDDQDISLVTQESLRSQISVVTQDTSMMNRSVLDNIRLGRLDASFEEVVEAARMASADDFIAGLTDVQGRTGYDAHVGDRGVNLSGGQRQRLAIARVILKNAPILILDEATSALDNEVEAAILNSLDILMKGKTVIAIAHRLSTIAAMDRLVVINAGSIVEEGTHKELLASGKYYARLWNSQSGGFIVDQASMRLANRLRISPRQWLARMSRRGVDR